MRTGIVTVQKAVNAVVGLICALSLLMMCGEPSEDVSMSEWVLWEAANLVVFALSARYLDRHTPAPPGVRRR